MLSLLTNKDSYNTQIVQCVNDTVFTKRFRVLGFGTGSGTLEPVPWNRFLRQITSGYSMQLTVVVDDRLGAGGLYGFKPPIEQTVMFLIKLIWCALVVLHYQHSAVSRHKF